MMVNLYPLKPSFSSILVSLFIIMQLPTTAVAATKYSGNRYNTTDNQPAIINGTDTGNVTEDVDPDGDNLLETSGKLNVTDSDAGESAFVAGTRSGKYGSLASIDAAGNWHYTASNTHMAIQNLATGQTLTETFTARTVDSTTHTVRITIRGADEANQPAVISGTSTGDVNEDVDPDGDNLLEVTGKLNVTDSDAGEAAFVAETRNGNYGSLTIDAAGYWRYAASNTQTAVQNLATGQTLADTFTVSTVDSTSHTVRITIRGTDEANQPAVISGTSTGDVNEDVDPDGDNLLEVTGKLNVTDSDAGEAAFVAETRNGNYGSLTIDAAGYWRYAASNTQTAVQNLATGQTLTDTFTISTVDSTSHTVRITIRGADEGNQPAVISGTSTGNVTKDVDPDGDNLLETSGKLNVTDSDAGEAAFVTGTRSGKYGSLAAIDAAGNWHYTASNTHTAIQNLATGQTLTETFTARTVDGTTHTVSITIRGADEGNQPAVISGTSTGSVTEDVDPDSDNLLEVSGKLNVTDSNAGEDNFVAGSRNGDYGSLMIDTAGNWSYAASNTQAAIQNLADGQTVSDSLVVNSVDGTEHTVVIAIRGADEASTTAEVTLSWTAPAEREDNSALSLSAIAGYRIYYGASQGQYSDNVTINDSSATDYTFADLPAGTYYFVVTTIDTDGLESQYSDPVSLSL
jgi:VCBS repeat-containing protein